MLIYLLLLFTIVPLIELTILVWIGGQTEWWVPIVLVIATGGIGAALARWQGWHVLRLIRADAAAGRVPADAMIDGLLILLAGILLVAPGVMADFAGVALLIPPLRAVVKHAVAAWIKRNIEVHVDRAQSGFWSSDGSTNSHRDAIIEARVIGTRVEDAD